MKIPEFEVGDAVMVQTGGKFMTIVGLNEIDESAKCAIGPSVQEFEWPLRSLVRLTDRVASLKPGDQVICRGECKYYVVLNYEAESETADCLGHDGKLRKKSIVSLVQMHIRYE